MIAREHPGRHADCCRISGAAAAREGRQVTFNDLGQGQTEVTVTLQWVVPASKGGETLAGLVADPAKRLEEDLLAFKRFVEQSVRTTA